MKVLAKGANKRAGEEVPCKLKPYIKYSSLKDVKESVYTFVEFTP
jgi:hypothetical protein